MSITVELNQRAKTVTIKVDDHGAELLRQAAEDSKAPAQVVIGEPGEPLLIVRHEDFHYDTADVVQALWCDACAEDLP
jgi:hypothetical protein